MTIRGFFMSIIEIKDLSFSYGGEDTPLFSSVCLDLDTDWRLGLIGRNGRGKTTFLKILLGELEHQGQIQSARSFDYFPAPVFDKGLPALEVARCIIAPFTQWEGEMQALLQEVTDENLARYGELESLYAAAEGYEIDEMIYMETGRLGVVPSALERAYYSLSGGEQIKIMLAAMFLKKDKFLLIDEPTDHLDREGRLAVSKWLASKKGFILVSHDREFLDASIDHVLSINRSSIELQAGNYTSWKENRQRQDNYEAVQNEKLQKDIERLQKAVKQTENWSLQGEKTKKGKASVAAIQKGAGSLDRGYVGHKAEKMMQRSKAIEKRKNRQIEEKKQMLLDVEEVDPLKFHLLPSPRKRLLTLDHVDFSYPGRGLLSDINLSIEEGQRLAIQGPNGCGKTTLLKLIAGALQPTAGKRSSVQDLQISFVSQQTDFLQGSLRAYCQRENLDETLLLTLLRKLDFERDAFARDMERYSAGQKKKVLLAASLAKPCQLFVWDEPLNYIDILSREQLEKAILAYQPTLVFVEHDQAFVQAVSTRILDLGTGDFINLLD